MIDLETPDAGDLDALDVLIDSDGWKLVKKRLESILEIERVHLEQNQSAENTGIARGKCSAIRTALRVPDILRLEIQKEIQ